MNKTQLVNYVCRRTKMNRKDCQSAINCTLEGIMKGTKSTKGMSLSGFGNFKCKKNKAERKYNKNTKRWTWTKATKEISFSPTKVYKDYVL